LSARRVTVGEALHDAAARLAAAAGGAARLDAEVLLAHVVGGGRTALITRRDEQLEDESRARYAALVARRAAREPVAYLTGEREFWSLPLEVDARVLIPRPETEGVVEAALAAVGELSRHSRAPLRIVDVGTGSGAIAVALAHELARRPPVPAASVVALDRSLACLQVARRNAARHAPPGRVSLLCSDLTRALGPRSVDLLVANPPYLSQDEIERVSPEVRAEPVAALLGGGKDGSDTLRALLDEATRVLQQGGFVVSEIGSTQGQTVAALARDLGFEEIEIERDLAGLDRVVKARWRSGLGATA